MFLYKKLPYVSQVDDRDCGVAALASILKNYGTIKSLAYLRGLAKTDMQGTNLLGISKAAQTLNFETKSIKANMSLLDITNLPYPFIAHVIKQSDTDSEYAHYYVIYKSTKTYVLIGDPDITIGIKKIPLSQFESEWSGVAIFMAPSPNYHPTKDHSSSLFSFIPLLLRQKKLIINIVLSALIVTTISIGGAYFLQLLIDKYIPQKSYSALIITSLGLITAYVFQQVLQYAEQYLLTIMNQRLSIDIILGYIKHIFELPMSFFATRRTGEIISRFTDANSIIDALANTLISIFLDFGIVLILGTFLMLQNSRLFSLVLLSIPIYAGIISIFSHKFERMNDEVMQSNSMLSSSIIEDINGIETIKSLNAEQFSYKKVDHEFVKALDKSFTYQQSQLIQQGLKDGLQLILNVLILFFGARLVISGSISLGQLITFNALLAYFTTPLQTIVNLQTKLQSAKVANNRLNEVFLVESEFNGSHYLIPQKQLYGDITFRDVSYSYNYGPLCLQNINFTIKQNSKIAIVGTSGSGKTTLMKLLSRLYDPTSGSITLNHTPSVELGWFSGH